MSKRGAEKVPEGPGPKAPGPKIGPKAVPKVVPKAAAEPPVADLLPVLQMRLARLESQAAEDNARLEWYLT